MLQANELRVGNWVDNDGYYQQIHFTDIADLSTGCGGAHLYKPVVLTPEILEKAGFVKEVRRDYGGDPFVVYFFDGVDIHEGNSPDEFNYATYVKGATSSFKAGIGVKWVHHLQNLIHSLTGTELNINL